VRKDGRFSKSQIGPKIQKKEKGIGKEKEDHVTVGKNWDVQQLRGGQPKQEVLLTHNCESSAGADG